ncbi:MAG: sigma-70 family RNA polymerase sigma factor [Chloroflexota bacterium]
MYRNDAVLIQACLGEDESAWKELVEHYSRLVYSIALRYGLPLTDADDVFQNVFLNVYRSLKTLRDQKLITAWIIKITYRECQRQRKRSPDHSELSESILDTAIPPEDEVEIWEQRHFIHLALQQIEPRCRELLNALFLESPPPSYETLAARLGAPVGSIGPWRARCFKKLAEILNTMGFHIQT